MEPKEAYTVLHGPTVLEPFRALSTVRAVEQCLGALRLQALFQPTQAWVGL